MRTSSDLAMGTVLEIVIDHPEATTSMIRKSLPGMRRLHVRRVLCQLKRNGSVCRSWKGLRLVWRPRRCASAQKASLIWMAMMPFLWKQHPPSQDVSEIPMRISQKKSSGGPWPETRSSS